MLESRMEHDGILEEHVVFGVVGVMDEDYVLVGIEGEDGIEEERFYYTFGFREIGIRTGDRVQLTFTETVKGNEFFYTMKVKGLGQSQTREEA